MKYAKLPETVPVLGTGIPNLTATLVQRTNKVCLYERSDGCYELFFVQFHPEEVLFDKHYPAREGYPSNDDFGNTAWCFRTRKLAVREFNKLIGGGNSGAGNKAPKSKK